MYFCGFFIVRKMGIAAIKRKKQQQQKKKIKERERETTFILSLGYFGINLLPFHVVYGIVFFFRSLSRLSHSIHMQLCMHNAQMPMNKVADLIVFIGLALFLWFGFFFIQSQNESSVYLVMFIIRYNIQVRFSFVLVFRPKYKIQK